MRGEGHYKQVFVTMGTISRDWEETTCRWERGKHLSSLRFLECKADRAMHLFALSFAYLDTLVCLYITTISDDQIKATLERLHFPSKM